MRLLLRFRRSQRSALLRHVRAREITAFPVGRQKRIRQNRSVTPTSIHHACANVRVARYRRRSTQRSHLLIAEENWFSVTGRVETVRIEDDGDVHIVLVNTDAQHGGIVVDLPLGPRWCEMRKTVFSWTDV